MGFNYLQTDDRDDYLAQFGSKKQQKTNPVLSVTLINPSGQVVLKEVRTQDIRMYYKKTYCNFGDRNKGIWRTKLEEKGYRVVNNRG